VDLRGEEVASETEYAISPEGSRVAVRFSELQARTADTNSSRKTRASRNHVRRSRAVAMSSFINRRPLGARGIAVEDIMSETRVQAHELTSFARIKGAYVTYPAPN
jgi:hypothetical protein